MKNKSKNEKTEKISISNLKEFKEIYFPNEVRKEKYDVNDPEKLGVLIAEENYSRHKEALLSMK